MNDIIILVLEDNPLDQIKMRVMLSKPISTLYRFHLGGIFTELDPLIHYLSGHQVDLVLSDIMIKEQPVGIHLLKKLRDASVPVILMTLSQEEELFVEAQQYRRVPYLIKPFHAISLQSTIEKALEEHYKNKLYDFLDKKYLYLSNKTGQRDRVWFDEIVYIEYDDNYCQFHTPTKKYLLRKSLSMLLSEDMNDLFIRVHHRYAINKIHIQIVKADLITLVGDITLPVGRSYKREVSDTLR
ncbi:response regulator [Runella sp. CRIBMP]|uniref:LytR/AlgR family response regulator transcription factor n=1 Tax=Runella sp. CRIBMP TaxID=2683261 RepID=UPI001411FB66|nr:LytTR family DNA-binding domain-containing protein [Runella sp. CRIBMP]NBB23451.1 response regulator [Runella sp. CRIBMP]